MPNKQVRTGSRPPKDAGPHAAGGTASRLAGVLVLAALLPGGGTARADVIVNNFGPGDSVAPADGWSWPGYTFGNPPGVDTVSHIDVAVGFTPARGFTLSRVTCSVFSEPTYAWLPGPPRAGYPFLLSLVADRGGLPLGKTLESWGELAPVSPAAESVRSVAHPTLVAGQRYWLVARSPNPFGGEVLDALGWSYAAEPAGLPTASKIDNHVVFRSYHSPWSGTDPNRRHRATEAESRIPGSCTSCRLAASGPPHMACNSFSRAFNARLRSEV